MGLNPAVSVLERKLSKRGFSCFSGGSPSSYRCRSGCTCRNPPRISQVNDLVDGAPQLLDSLRNNKTFLALDEDYGLIKTLEDKFQTWFTDGTLITGAFGGVLGVGRTVLSGTFSALTVLILTLYFLYSLPSVTKVFYRLAPASRRERVSKIGDAIIARVGAFVGSQIVIAFFASIFVFYSA